MGANVAEKATNLAGSASNLKESAVVKPETNRSDKSLMSGWAALEGVESAKQLRQELIDTVCKFMKEENRPEERQKRTLERTIPIFNKIAVITLEQRQESKETISEFLEGVEKTQKDEIEALLKRNKEDWVPLRK